MLTWSKERGGNTAGYLQACYRAELQKHTVLSSSILILKVMRVKQFNSTVTAG